jgi:hypothetical protein
MRNRMDMPYFLGRKQVILESTKQGVNVSLKRAHGPGTLILWEQIIRMVYPGVVKIPNREPEEK